MTMEAVEALQAAEIVVGYKTYTHRVKAFTGDKQVIKTGMCKEIERCRGGHRAGAGRAQRCADQQRRRRHLRHGGAGAGAG